MGFGALDIKAHDLPFYPESGTRVAYASAGTRPERAEAAGLVDEEANALAAERNEAPFLRPE
jgi:hypothetical protein